MPHVDRCPTCVTTKLEFERATEVTIGGEPDDSGFEWERWLCRTCGRRFLLAKLDWPIWFYRTYEEERDANAKLRWGERPAKPKALQRAAVAQAKAERDEALDEVSHGVSPIWKQKAYDALVSLAYQQPEIMADDLWEVVEQPPEPRAAGAIFMKAAKNEIIVKTDEHRPSARRHATDMVVWRSKVYGTTPQQALVAEGQF